MPDNPEHGYTIRGFTNAQVNDVMISVAIDKMQGWSETAQIATKPNTPRELIKEVLSQKKDLDELINQARIKLNRSERLRISGTVNEIDELEKALRDKLPKESKGKGKGLTKKRKSRRIRNKRHRKSTRRRHRKH
jgi:hypothetical protein